MGTSLVSDAFNLFCVVSEPEAWTLDWEDVIWEDSWRQLLLWDWDAFVISRKMLMSFHRMKGPFESLPSHCKFEVWISLMALVADQSDCNSDSWQAITRDMLRILDQWRSMIKLVGRALSLSILPLRRLGSWSTSERDPLFCARALPLNCQPTK